MKVPVMITVCEGLFLMFMDRQKQVVVLPRECMHGCNVHSWGMKVGKQFYLEE
jgi:hypothetical protein